jgi:hypothetical protein
MRRLEGVSPVISLVGQPKEYEGVMKREAIRQDPKKVALSASWPEIGSSGLDVGDRSLIHSMLERTPIERLTYLQELVDGLVALRHGHIAGQ